MKQKEFDKYWDENKKKLLQADEEYCNAIKGYKMTSGADWLLFGIPIAAGIVFIDYCPVNNEIGKWLLCALVTIVCFVICVAIKTYTSGNKSLDEIEKRVKQDALNKYINIHKQ